MDFLNAVVNAGWSGLIFGFFLFYGSKLAKEFFSFSLWGLFGIFMVALTANILIPHGWNLLELKMSDHPSFDLIMKTSEADQWFYIKTKFCTFIVGWIAALFLQSKLDGQW